MTARKKIIPELLYIFVFILNTLLVFPQNGFSGIDTTDYLQFPDGIDYNLMIASSKGYSGEVVRLLRKGADIESMTNEGVTPLMFAVVNNHPECTGILLSSGANPNIITTYFETPLLASVKNGNSEITELLIRSKADISWSDYNGATPLHYASISGNITITDMLLYYGATIDNSSNDGTTPLMSAVWAGFTDIADLLLQNGADVNRKDNKGFSPFLIASQNGDTLTMSMLIKFNADIYATNNFGYNALSLAIKENQTYAVDFLLGKGNLWPVMLNDAINPFSVAIKYGRKKIIGKLENEKGFIRPRMSFDQARISASIKTGNQSFLTGMAISLKEPLLNAGFIFGYDFKPIESRVLLKIDESLFYQYFDKRSVVYAGIFKEFDLTDKSLKSYWAFYMSVAGSYTIGNYYSGTRVGPDKKVRILPSAYLKWQKNNIDIYGGIDYMKTELYKVGPLWFRLGCSYDIFFDKTRSPGKVIKW